MTQERYKIIRHYMRGPFRHRVIETSLTLEQAQEHCRDPETSSRTATSWRARERTKRHGAWFDGYERA